LEKAVSVSRVLMEAAFCFAGTGLSCSGMRQRHRALWGFQYVKIKGTELGKHIVLDAWMINRHTEKHIILDAAWHLKLDTGI
jgi:hypothetical protein